MDIVIGKIVTGELIVGKLSETGINDAYLLIITPDNIQQGRFKSLIVPMMMPFADGAIKEISFDKIIATIPAPEDVYSVYIKLTTGIDVVSTGTKIIQ